MSLALSAAARPMGLPIRALLFGVAAVLGLLGGYTWSLDASNFLYNGLLSTFIDPGAKIEPMATGIGLGFLLGFVHITSIWWLPAAFAAMPLVQEAPNKRDWLKVAGVLTVSIVLVTTLFGAVLGAPAAALAGVVGSKRTMGLIMQSTLVITGLAMLVVALGELGLIRRLLPEVRFDPRPAEGAGAAGARGTYRRAAILGVTMAATFGIACTKPLYLALLVYVALIGNIAYGALALGAYGLGMAASVALAGFVLLFLPAGRFGRLLRWLEDRQEAFHIVQGLVFAVAGGLAVSFFLVRYGALIPPMWSLSIVHSDWTARLIRRSRLRFRINLKPAVEPTAATSSGSVAAPSRIGRVVQVSVSAGGVPKRAVERARLDRLGLDGDQHSDRVGHGGPERAVCLLAMEVIETLQRDGHPIEPGTIGENLTISGLNWSAVRPGDRLRIGSALIEITRFTTPCTNIRAAFRDGDFTRVLQQKNPGQARLYAKVLEPGELAPGQAVEFLPAAVQR